MATLNLLHRYFISKSHWHEEDGERTQNPRRRSPSRPRLPSTPPSYSNSVPQMPNPRYTSIAQSAPQWLWSVSQCRIWITAVCVVYLNYTVTQGEEAAYRFKGFGPRLFALGMQDWIDIMRCEGAGESMHSLVFGYRKCEGGVPEGVRFGHWDNVKDDEEPGRWERVDIGTQ